MQASGIIAADADADPVSNSDFARIRWPDQQPARLSHAADRRRSCVRRIGAGGSHSKGRTAEKKGGDLSTCQSNSAAEVMGCKTPIRLEAAIEDDGPQKAEETYRRSFESDSSLKDWRSK